MWQKVWFVNAKKEKNKFLSFPGNSNEFTKILGKIWMCNITTL